MNFGWMKRIDGIMNFRVEAEGSFDPAHEWSSSSRASSLAEDCSLHSTGEYLSHIMRIENSIGTMWEFLVLLMGAIAFIGWVAYVKWKSTRKRFRDETETYRQVSMNDVKNRAKEWKPEDGVVIRHNIINKCDNEESRWKKIRDAGKSDVQEIDNSERLESVTPELSAMTPELVSSAPSIYYDSPDESYDPNAHAGTISFPDGSTYSGEVFNGKPHGQGVLHWKNGDRYEGEFVNGLQHGQGTLSSHDGNLYFGGWDEGKVHGRGVLKPLSTLNNATSETRQTLRLSNMHDQPSPVIALFRDYSHGELKREVVLHAQGQAAGRKSFAKRAKKAAVADITPVASRPLAPGEVVFKGHKSYDLMRQLQLGIMYSIAQSSASDADHKKLNLKKDIANEEVQYFPSDTGVFGGDFPAFKWKNYAPKTFHRLRELFGIDPADYLVSLTGGPALRELPSPGASGAIFFLSEDDRFLIKSVKKEEMYALLSIALRKYYEHVEQHPDTLLVRFYGIHRISPWLGRNARFIIMGNVLPSGVRIHRKYDLKGSTYKRTVGKDRRNTDPLAVLKDLDLDMQFECEASERDSLLQNLRADAKFLQRLGVIDYSLLLGVHFLEWGEDTWCPPFKDWPERRPNRAERQGSLSIGDSLAKSLTGIDLNGMDSRENFADEEFYCELDEISQCAAFIVSRANSARKSARISAATASRRGMVNEDGRNLPIADSKSSNIADLEAISESEPCSPSSNRNAWLRRSLGGSRRHMAGRSSGWAVKATAVRRTNSGKVQREPVLLYFGIIDFLQTYNARKFVERTWKKSLHGPGVSVADPKTYARRFIDLMEKTFCEDGSGGSVS